MKGGIGSRRKNKHVWSLLILLLSVASIRRKLLKTTFVEEHIASIQIRTVAIFNWDLEKSINSKQIRYSDITTNSHRLFFNAFVYSWYFIIFFTFYDLNSYFWKNLFLLIGFLIMKTTFLYFPGMFENPAPAKYY